MIGPDGRNCNNTMTGEIVSTCQLVLRRRGRTDSTFVCSASWIHSNHAERVGPIVDGEGMVDLLCLNALHSDEILAGKTHTDLDRSHLKSRGGGSISASRHDHLLAPRRAARFAPNR
jgi:hypothetical protein